MTVEAVVFDIGNVLIEWDPEGAYDRRLGRERRERFLQEVAMFEMHLGLDRGDPFRATVYELAERHPDWAEQIRHWHDGWLDTIPGEIAHSVRLLRSLRAKQVPVFALSNFNRDALEVTRRAYPVLDEFDQAYISGDLRCIKPDPAIYAHLERGSQVAPGALLFVDDRAENIDAAAERGWQTHLFTGPQGWAECLVDAGLLTMEEAQ